MTEIMNTYYAVGGIGCHGRGVNMEVDGALPGGRGLIG